MGRVNRAGAFVFSLVARPLSGAPPVSAPTTELDFDAADAIAAAFVRARRAAAPLAKYPGPVPPDRISAYACQEAAIVLWPDAIAGWKIGRPAPGLEKAFGENRLIGPIFKRAVRKAEGVVEAPFIDGGFGAVEAEFVLKIGRDAPPEKIDWTIEEAADIVGAMHIGVEMAGSPFAGINALGPTVTVSDFGNNTGLILGPEVKGWRARADADLVSETFIDGASVGRGTASTAIGGPFDALRFLLGHAAERGRPLTAGQLVSTGAVTGVHEILIGQSAKMVFGDDGEIRCAAVRAAPASAAFEAAR
jgi:2-keto-4-pentenoate hydratase